MSQRLIACSPDLKQLQDDGYDITTRGATVIIRGVPYGLLPLDGLVVLFGSNSGGKTTVLEAAGQLLGSEGHLRRDPGDDGGDPYAVGHVWFDLPGANLPTFEDHRIMRDLLAGKHLADGHPWSFLDSEASELLADATFEDIR